MNPAENQQLDHLIHLIYAAADDPVNWPRFLLSYIEMADQSVAMETSSSKLPNAPKPDNEIIAATLIPHLERSFNLGLKLQGVKDNQSHLHATLDQLPMAILLVDRSLLIQHCNQLAMQLLQKADVIGEQNGALIAIQSKNHRRIRIAVETAITEQRAISLPIAAPLVGESILTLLISPVGDRTDLTNCHAGIFIARREAMNIHVGSIKSLFGLTTAEADLALQLVNGHSMSEYAKIKGVSNNTLRSQLRSIFDKTGTNRQPDLVSLILTSTASLRPPEPSIKLQISGNLHQRTSQEFLLRDGRKLAYAEFGSPNGWPIIYCHGLRGSRLERPPDGVLESLPRLRLIVIDRPGYGLSSPLLSRGFTDWPEDVEQLINSLNIKRCSLLGFSMGGAYAMALSAAMPERIHTLGLAGTVAPLNAPVEMNTIKNGQRILASLARFSPSLLTDIIEMTSTDIYRNPERFIDRFMLHNCSPDIALMQQPELRRLYLEAMKESGRFGNRHIAEEMIRLSHDWGFSISNVRCPTHIWHGDEDPTVPIGQVRSMAKSIPNVTFTTLSEFGHFFLYGKWKEILDSLMIDSK